MKTAFSVLVGLAIVLLSFICLVAPLTAIFWILLGGFLESGGSSLLVLIPVYLLAGAAACFLAVRALDGMNRSTVESRVMGHLILGPILMAGGVGYGIYQAVQGLSIVQDIAYFLVGGFLLGYGLHLSRKGTQVQ